MGVYRIFVTGISGFIGFHLALALNKIGYFVIGCDNFNDYYDPEIKKRRAAILSQQGIKIFDYDINETNKITEIIDRHQITHMVHLAAQAGVRYSLSHPEKYIEANICGFQSILEICKKFKLKLIFASSSSVYGLNKKTPFAETDPTDQPASFYAVTKKTNELMAHSYHHLYGISCVGLRFFTVYGPWGRPDMACFMFTKSIFEEKPISVYAQGLLKRDFTYIDDIVEGVISALKYEAGYEIFNLGNQTPRSVMDVVQLLEGFIGKKALINFLPFQEGDVQETFADMRKSEQLLGFSPKVSLEDGLKDFVDWFKSYLKETV
ncbi:MAG: GDP-mannose 4,6-dehydratase [Rhabdochlamydiaceae bacterium]